MEARVQITVDCVGRPATVSVSAVVRTGEDELDLVLFRQMAVAVRHFADEVNTDQETLAEAAPADDALSPEHEPPERSKQPEVRDA